MEYKGACKKQRWREETSTDITLTRETESCRSQQRNIYTGFRFFFYNFIWGKYFYFENLISSHGKGIG